MSASRERLTPLATGTSTSVAAELQFAEQCVRSDNSDCHISRENNHILVLHIHTILNNRNNCVPASSSNTVQQLHPYGYAYACFRQSLSDSVSASIVKKQTSVITPHCTLPLELSPTLLKPGPCLAAVQKKNKKKIIVLRQLHNRCHCNGIDTTYPLLICWPHPDH